MPRSLPGFMNGLGSEGIPGTVESVVKAEPGESRGEISVCGVGHRNIAVIQGVIHQKAPGVDHQIGRMQIAFQHGLAGIRDSGFHRQGGVPVRNSESGVAFGIVPVFVIRNHNVRIGEAGVPEQIHLEDFPAGDRHGPDEPGHVFGFVECGDHRVDLDAAVPADLNHSIQQGGKPLAFQDPAASGAPADFLQGFRIHAVYGEPEAGEQGDMSFQPRIGNQKSVGDYGYRMSQGMDIRGDGGKIRMHKRLASGNVEGAAGHKAPAAVDDFPPGVKAEYPAGSEMGEAVPAAVIAGFNNVEIELESVPGHLRGGGSGNGNGSKAGSAAGNGAGILGGHRAPHCCFLMAGGVCQALLLPFLNYRLPGRPLRNKKVRTVMPP